MARSSLIDVPIDKFDDDSLELGGFATALSEFISTCETPITIGIQGDWGIGKTSLLHMITDRLAPKRGRKRFASLYFNTWQYAQFKNQEFLSLSLIEGIIRVLEQNFNDLDEERIRKLRSYGEAFVRFAGRVGGQILSEKLGVDVEKAMEEPEKKPVEECSSHVDIARILEDYKKQFQELVSSVLSNEKRPVERLVIMIDDLDRLKPSRALELLEAIKLFLDVQGCVFVLAVDYAVIQQGVAEKFGTDTQKTYGRSFFDKIIQVPFNMPTTSYQLDKYIMSLLGWTKIDGSYVQNEDNSGDYLSVRRGTSIDNEIVNYFTNVCRLTAGANPRSIKRIINYASLLKIVCRQKRAGTGKKWKTEDAQNLFALACMHLTWPEVFTYLAENPTPGTLKKFEDWSFIEGEVSFSPLLERCHNEVQLKSNISAFFDELISLIDTDGDGTITPQEFRPLWDIMIEANLTNTTLEELDASLEKLQKLAVSLCKKDGANIGNFIKMFKKSLWNNSFRLRLVPAGKRFYNLLWDGHQIGSIATTTREPIQFYLKPELEWFHENELLVPHMEEVGSNHYGIGDVKVKLTGLLENQATGIDILNAIKERVEKWLSEHTKK